MNKEVEPSSSFFGQPAAMTFFFGASIRRNRRRRWRWRGGDLEKKEELWWKVALSAQPFTGSYHPEQVQIIFGTSKNILEKNTCYVTSFYKFSCTLIADLVCYATFHIVIVSQTGIKIWCELPLSIVESRILNKGTVTWISLWFWHFWFCQICVFFFFFHVKIILTCFMWSSVCLTKVFDLWLTVLKGKNPCQFKSQFTFL